MKRQVVWSLLPLVVLVGAVLSYTPSASSTSSNQLTLTPQVASGTFNLFMPLPINLDVDRTDDTAAATACTAAPNDCSLRGAVIAANADLGADPVIINLQAATTYNLDLANATQENAAVTGDLDITTTLHSVTIVGGGPSTIIDAAGLTSGNMRDRAFQITGPAVTAIFEDLAIQNGQAADDGSSGASTNPATQNATRVGGCILNGAGYDPVTLLAVSGGGSVTLTNVVVENCTILGKGDDQINQHRTLDAYGGGLASIGLTGNVSITDSTFTGNTALGGNGGNFNNGNASNAKGGSIYIEGGALNINLSRIEASQANGGNGGSVEQDFHNNGGAGGFAQGGGVWIGPATATINNTTFEDTEANGGPSGTGGNGVNPGGNADGGGLFSLGTTTVTNSTFHLGEANGGDGGDAFGPTCIGGHMAGDGGGGRGGAIFADGGTMTINTATFNGNLATGGNGGDGGQNDGGLNCGNHGAGGLAHGGAITNANTATLNIKHGTISGNNAQAGNTGVNTPGVNKPARLVAEGTGGGIRVGSGSVTLENTIIAGNTAANGLGDTTGAPIPGPDVDGAVNSNGHNLIGNATEATGFTGTGDLIGANPMLGALADNGGPTETMEPQPGSDAIDAGVAAGSTTDQRGEARTVNDPGVADEATSDGTDIGAFETEVPCVLVCPGNVSADNDPDECGAVVNYTAPPSGEACGTVTCAPASGSFFPVGVTTVTCTSSVGPTCSFTVTVNDTQVPEITTTDSTMWPPNHKYVTFDVSDLVTSVSDNCDEDIGVGDVEIISVSSDETDNGGGDGNTINDIVIAGDCKSVQLRSERKSPGNGRVYTITFRVTDDAGNVSTATATVSVPHSQRGAAAVDDGPDHTVLSSCN
ncbi:MAG TPA: choice-of-anchor Q domain-containing protein [Pyrinomonadaceae bacterium]|nr:choice-of-anchor Q domain-containing protein [Pyrinomonadaceae bacterium]